MSNKWRYILGTATIVVIVGGTIYAIKKAKDLKESEENEMTAEEAQEMMDAYKEAMDKQHNDIGEVVDEDELRDTVKVGEEFEEWYNKNKDKITELSKRDNVTIVNNVHGVKLKGQVVDVVNDEVTFDNLQPLEEEHITYAKADAEATLKLHEALKEDGFEEDTNDITREVPDEEVDMEEVIDDIRDTASWNASFVTNPPVEGPVPFAGSDNFYDNVDFEVPLSETITEEDKVLRFEPSSVEARQQFIKMELADWVPMSDPYQSMLKLYDFPFKPQNEGDRHLRNNLMDHRVQFFGFVSRWTKEVSFADVILHYARLAEFNIGETVAFWVEYILEFNELDHTTPSNEIDEALVDLNKHVYYNQRKDTFGLFGLTSEYMDEAIRIANGHVDQSVTYEIEFNEFLKSCL